MPKMKIARSIEIAAPIDKVFNQLNQFASWPTWSPWLIQEPEAKVDMASNGKSYSWAGKKVGEGKMKVVSEEPMRSVDYDLEFLKPWKSQAKVKFETEKLSNGNTKVTWGMDSSLPFFMFWMKNKMEAFIGNDYDRGLRMLKDYLENGQVYSQMSNEGISQFPGSKYIGVRRKATVDNAPNAMKSDFENLASETIGKYAGLDMTNAICIYHKWDLVKGDVEYTAAIMCDEIPSGLSDNYVQGSLAPSKQLRIKHTGKYDHLGNPWSMAYGMIQRKEVKPIKKYHPYESYGNSPKNTKPEDLVTYLHFPVK